MTVWNYYATQLSLTIQYYPHEEVNRVYLARLKIEYLCDQKQFFTFFLQEIVIELEGTRRKEFGFEASTSS